MDAGIFVNAATFFYKLLRDHLGGVEDNRIGRLTAEQIELTEVEIDRRLVNAVNEYERARRRELEQSKQHLRRLGAGSSATSQTVPREINRKYDMVIADLKAEAGYVKQMLLLEKQKFVEV